MKMKRELLNGLNNIHNNTFFLKEAVNKLAIPNISKEDLNTTIAEIVTINTEVGETVGLLNDHLKQLQTELEENKTVA